jgi:hypothetical protein
VGHGVVNKRQGNEIGLTRDRLAEEDRPGRSPASDGGGAEAARPRELGWRWRRGRLLTVKIRQPSHEFTFGVGMSFIPYPLVLTPVV